MTKKRKKDLLLRENVPNAERVVVTSTGEAARIAKEDKDICCIANSYAIDLLQLNILTINSFHLNLHNNYLKDLTSN